MSHSSSPSVQSCFRVISLWDDDHKEAQADRLNLEMVSPSAPSTPYKAGAAVLSHSDVEAGEQNRPAIEVPSRFGTRPACYKSTFHEVAFIFVCMTAVGMGSFVMGTTMVISDTIAQALNLTSGETAWISAAPALTSGAFLLLFGRVADMFGGRNQLILSYAGFALFALIAGFAKNGITLDCLTATMGLFTASAVPPAQAILARSYGARPSRRKNVAFAVFSAGYPTCFGVSLIISAISAKVAGWRGSFFFMAIMFAACTVLAFFVTPVFPEMGQSRDGEKERGHAVEAAPSSSLSSFSRCWDIAARLDLIGAFLTIIGVGLFVASLSVANEASDGWKTPHVLAMLIVGLLSIVAFIFWELHCTHPLVNMRIWRDRDFALLVFGNTLGILAFPATQFWLALYMQRVRHDSALKVAVQFLPMGIVGLIVNAVAGTFLHRLSNKLLMGFGAAGYTAAFLLFSLHRDGVTYWAFLFPGMCLAVVGADLTFNVANMYVMTTMPFDSQAVAGGLIQTLSRLGGAIGLGATTAIFNATQRQFLNGDPVRDYYRGGPYRPYATAMWFSAAVASLGLFLVPFLRITTQGGNEVKSLQVETDLTISERPCTTKQDEKV